jgi:hypothetical protein
MNKFEKIKRQNVVGSKSDRSLWVTFVDTIRREDIRNSPLALSYETFKYGLWLGRLQGKTFPDKRE